MSADFVARLGSRASVPGEVRSRWGIGEYVAAFGGPADRRAAHARLDALAHGAARSLRRLDPARLLALATAMAHPPSAELNKARLAAASGIPPTTISSYVDVLERLGVVRLLPGTRSSIAKRAIGRPRVFFDDPVTALHLSGVTSEELLQMRGRARLAPLVEGLAVAELVRQQATSAVDYRLTHLRERNGLHVDLLVELPDETVYGLEIRTAAAFRPHQFAGLEALAARAGSRFRGGVVLNTAPVGLAYRPGLWTLPVSALWDWEGD